MRCIKYQRLMETTLVTPPLHRINSSVNKKHKTNKTSGGQIQLWCYGHKWPKHVQRTK